MIDRCYIEITNTCNLNCDFCPKHHRRKRQLSAGEFNLLTDRVRGKVSFLYFHLMGEPLLHPLLPQFIRTANEKGFKTVLTSNGTLLHRCLPLLEALPHKIQLSLHSHESNARGELAGYMQEVMQFSVQAAEKGTCMVLRLWNQGGRDKENEEVMRLIEQYVPKPWKERPDGFRLSDHLYLEFDRKFEWPTAGEKSEENLKDESEEESENGSKENLKNESEEESENESGEKSSKKEKKQLFCKALIKQIGVLSDGSLVPCCLDHDGACSRVPSRRYRPAHDSCYRGYSPPYLRHTHRVHRQNCTILFPFLVRFISVISNYFIIDMLARKSYIIYTPVHELPPRLCR